MRIAIFASGNGSNFEALAEAFCQKEIPGQLICLFSDQKNAYVLERAKKRKIPYFVLTKDKAESKADYEKKILQILKKEKIDLIILAGYMRIIGNTLLDVYPNRIINIHPSLLPKFPGKNGIKDAYEADDLTTGITIHLVDSGVDTGPILFQKTLQKKENESLENLEERIHQLEHRYYPKVITDFIRETTEYDK